jgi:hypothetical protein
LSEGFGSSAPDCIANEPAVRLILVEFSIIVAVMTLRSLSESRGSRRLVLAGFCGVLALSLSGQTPDISRKPNFTGRWRMVKDRSEFHGFKMPDGVVRVVDHRDPVLNLHTLQTTGTKTSIADVSYFTDGSPSTNTINGREAQSKAYWDGPALVIRTTMKNAKGDNELIEDRWELSADGQTLTTTSHVSTEQGGAILTLVCEKESVNR